MKTVTIGTLKGGTGKSSTLFNLAGLIAEQHKILLIDCDPQTNLSLNCGVDITAKGIKTVKNIFDDDATAQEVIFKNPIKELVNIDIIPSSITLTATELQIVSRAGRENILYNFILDNQAILNEYAYILIDTSPSMGIVNQNAFFVADSVILVSDVSINGIQGAELFIELWGNARKYLRKTDNVKALVLNNFDKRIKLSGELMDYCKENESIKNIVLENVIPASVQVKNTEIEHKPINLIHKNAAIHKAYKDVAQELQKRGVL
ncbi:MAG: ParA family protein [Oscillospiraceae bacterium]|nr:ParA family protein [Oscillospiraceae bacterium]